MNSDIVVWEWLIKMEEREAKMGAKFNFFSYVFAVISD